jgi:transcriptional regulator with XRE-family HTH domain
MYNVPMATNERLRAALLKAGLSIDELAAVTDVDPKTCQRWVTKGRTPHRVNAKRAAVALREDMSYLWPEVERGRQRRDMHPDLVALYASRADAPQERSFTTRR